MGEYGIIILDKRQQLRWDEEDSLSLKREHGENP